MRVERRIWFTGFRSVNMKNFESLPWSKVLISPLDSHDVTQCMGDSDNVRLAELTLFCYTIYVRTITVY
jgi:hypothetical protein